MSVYRTFIFVSSFHTIAKPEVRTVRLECNYLNGYFDNQKITLDINSFKIALNNCIPLSNYLSVIDIKFIFENSQLCPPTFYVAIKAKVFVRPNIRPTKMAVNVFYFLINVNTSIINERVYANRAEADIFFPSDFHSE